MQPAYRALYKAGDQSGKRAPLFPWDNLFEQGNVFLARLCLSYLNLDPPPDDAAGRHRSESFDLLHTPVMSVELIIVFGHLRDILVIDGPNLVIVSVSDMFAAIIFFFSARMSRQAKQGSFQPQHRQPFLFEQGRYC